LDAGLSPVVVVSGAYTEALKPVLVGLPVSVVYNPDWQDGQGTSVGAGVKALPPESGAAIFLLADQPKIPVSLLHALMETHAETLSPIVAPKAAGQPANPVLFDCSVFKDLAALSGSAGGRQLFSSYPVTWVDWNDPSVFEDIDTLDDYDQLIKQ
jgi:molybdenum cofactor cytidylyltransferase